MIAVPPVVALVAAVTKEWGIGANGGLPWHPKRLHLDMAFMKYVSMHGFRMSSQGVDFFEPPTKNAVIMGRKTWESLPPRFRPLDGRMNIVVTSDPKAFKTLNADVEVEAALTVDEAIQLASASGSAFVYILGGSKIYEDGIAHPCCQTAFLTVLTDHQPMPCDIFFPASAFQAAFTEAFNISSQSLDILKGTLPKSAQVTPCDDGQSLGENGVVYSIKAFTKKCL